VYLEL